MSSRHRPVMLFGMSFFALFTFVCALAPSFIGLVIARAFQGMNIFTLDGFEPCPHFTFLKQCSSGRMVAEKQLNFGGVAGHLKAIVGARTTTDN